MVIPLYPSHPAGLHETGGRFPAESVADLAWNYLFDVITSNIRRTISAHLLPLSLRGNHQETTHGRTNQQAQLQQMSSH